MANVEETRQKVVIYLVQHKIVDEAERQNVINRVLSETAPALIEADRATGLSDEEIFLRHADAWFQAHGDEIGNNGTNPPKSGSNTTPPAPGLTAEEQARLDMIINENAVAKGTRADQSQVVAVLTDKPVMSQIYVDGTPLTPVIPVNAEEQLKKYEAELVDTPENKAAFAELKAAWMKKEPMKVYVNPKARPKTIGFKVNTLGENNTPETRIMSKEEAIVFLACEVNGIVKARGENSVGIKLRWRENKKADVANNASAGTSVVAIINGKVMQTNPQLMECTSAIVDGEFNDKFRAKTDKSFLRVGKRKKADGTVINVTTRLSGVTQVKAVKRKDEYLAAFGALGARKNGGQSKKDIQATTDAVRRTIKSMTEGKMVSSSSMVRQAQAQVRQKFMSTGGQSNSQML